MNASATTTIAALTRRVWRSGLIVLTASCGPSRSSSARGPNLTAYLVQRAQRPRAPRRRAAVAGRPHGRPRAAPARGARLPGHRGRGDRATAALERRPVRALADGGAAADARGPPTPGGA